MDARAAATWIGTTDGVWRELASAEDLSVNFVADAAGLPGGGAVEARYVRREDGYFVAYLSSHTGCRLACRFCHLTASGQTMFAPVGRAGFSAQARRVLDHHAARVAAGREPPASRVNFNWMARGEPLANPAMLEAGELVADDLLRMAAGAGLAAALNVSTIMPAGLLEGALERGFGDAPFTPYYSLYSVDPAFRRRWLPRAMPAPEALARLAAWQRGRAARGLASEVVLHWAFIAGQNDRDADAEGIAEAVLRAGLRVRLNAVRYNPFSAARGAEPPASRVRDLHARLARALGADPGSRVVPRVGLDVRASCGMFVPA